MRQVRVSALVVATCLWYPITVAKAQRCTSPPDLLLDWMQATTSMAATFAGIDSVLSVERSRVARLPNPFAAIYAMDSAQLARASERRLWKDSSLMILVDKFASSFELLVIPRDTLAFLTDATPSLRGRLASAAAAAADAMAGASGRSCDSAATRIYVSPPPGLSVRQLHVHVAPRDPIEPADEGRFLDDLRTRLIGLLSTP